MTKKTVFDNFLQSAREVYNKVRQVLQSVVVTTKCDVTLFKGPKIWSLVLSDIKNSENLEILKNSETLEIFKQKIRYWKPDNYCSCRLCFPSGFKNPYH